MLCCACTRGSDEGARVSQDGKLFCFAARWDCWRITCGAWRSRTGGPGPWRPGRASRLRARRHPRKKLCPTPISRPGPASAGWQANPSANFCGPCWGTLESVLEGSGLRSQESEHSQGLTGWLMVSVAHQSLPVALRLCVRGDHDSTRGRSKITPDVSLRLLRKSASGAVHALRHC